MPKHHTTNYPSRHPPFFTGRVWIGLARMPRPIPIDGDAVRLQAALLDPRTRQAPPPLWRRAINFLWSLA